MDNTKQLIKKLTSNNKMVAVMESCTGGGFSNAITNVEGASKVFKYSAVTYNDEYKIKMGVSKDIIEKYGIYSIETSQHMSKAISDFANSDYGVGITGIISEIVFVSIYIKGQNEYKSYCIELNNHNRIENKQQIILYITERLLEIL